MPSKPSKFQEKLAKLPKSVSIAGLILFIVLLYVMLQKGITPFVMKVVESDWFFEKDEEQEELGKISNARGVQAFSQCKSVMVAEKHVPETAQFIDKDYEAWALGGRTYLIRSHVNVSSEKGMEDRKYACKIKYNGGDLNDAKSWDILGVDFNEPS
jgi:hypothetical protein